MALFLITGLPGSGKSTVYAELKKRGYEAYDGDYDHFAKWYNNTTGEPIHEERYHERSPEFLQEHSRNIAYQLVKDLAIKAQNTIVFLCADPENEDELVGLFDEVFALRIDENIRQKRLATRTNNTWGKLPHEVAYDLAVKPVALARYDKYDYKIIDSNRPIEDIIDFIVASSSNI